MQLETHLDTSPQYAALLKNNKSITIGVPKEKDSQENRVALNPSAVSILCQNGFEVLVEKNAGLKANFTDAEYLLAGASIKESPDEVMQTLIVLKINPPTPHELDLLRQNSFLISSIGNGPDLENTISVLIKKRITFLAFEYLEDSQGEKSIVRAMSEIAGSAVLLIAAEYLSSIHAGKGIVLGGITGLPPAQIVILGAGTVAEYAARTALGLGANVKVFDSEIYRLKRLKALLSHSLYAAILDQIHLKKAIEEADLVIGALSPKDLAKGYKIPEDWVADMKPNAVLIDVSIDRGGCFETSKPTSHFSPVFKQHGVIHYCVPNIASRFAHTASCVLSGVLEQILLKSTNEGGLESSILQNHNLVKGLVTFQGNVVNLEIAQKYKLKYKDPGIFNLGIN